VTAPKTPGYYLASTSDDHGTAAKLLSILRAGPAEQWPIAPGEFLEFLDFKHWLLAIRPEGLFTALTEFGEGIGISDQGSATAGRHAENDARPEAVMITPTHFVARPQAASIRARFLGLMDDWRAEGSRATHELDAMVVRFGDSYRVRVDD
jgi:hypothetical protein